MKRSFSKNIEHETLKNSNYRRVLYTTKTRESYTQLVLMSLQPGEEIGNEIHNNTTQFIRVEAGKAGRS
jgi:mannose-6-phosphate isomerase-like protein (cupin superfamily)